MVISEPNARPRRAVTDRLKESRREAILGVAAELFCREPFASITMNSIADGVGLAKGTLYLYFRTREEIFLVLFAREFNRWLESFACAAQKLASPGHVLDWIAVSLAERREFLRLGVLLHSVLEMNLSADAARTFKLEFHKALSSAAPVFASALHLQDAASGGRFLRWLQVCVVGIAEMAFPSSAMKAAIDEEPRLADMSIDFGRELRKMLGALVSGMHREEAENGR